MAGARPEKGWNLQGAAPDGTRKRPVNVEGRGGGHEWGAPRMQGPRAFVLPELGPWMQPVQITPSDPPDLCIHSSA